MPFRFVPVGANASLQELLSVTNGNFAQLDTEAVTKVFKGPNNVNALINGKLPNNLGYGIQFSDTSDVPRIIAYIDSNNRPVFKISNDGVDVTTAANDQLIFNSQQDVLKVVATGTISIAGANASSTRTSTLSIPALADIPAYIAFLPQSLNYGTLALELSLVSLPAVGGGVAAIAVINYTNAYSSGGIAKIDFATTNFQNALNDPNTYIWRYYVLQETGAV